MPRKKTGGTRPSRSRRSQATPAPQATPTAPQGYEAAGSTESPTPNESPVGPHQQSKGSQAQVGQPGGGQVIQSASTLSNAIDNSLVGCAPASLFLARGPRGSQAVCFDVFGIWIMKS